MTAPDRTLIRAPRGNVRCVDVDGVVAYRSTSGEWTPWEFATDRRFTGRWDDQAGGVANPVRRGDPPVLLSRGPGLRAHE